MFLKQKISILGLFLKDYVTLKTENELNELHNTWLIFTDIYLFIYDSTSSIKYEEEKKTKC